MYGRRLQRGMGQTVLDPFYAPDQTGFVNYGPSPSQLGIPSPSVEVTSDVLSGTGPVQAPSKTVQWLNAHAWQVAIGAVAAVALFGIFGGQRR